MSNIGTQRMKIEKRLQFLEEFKRELKTQSDRGVVLVCLSILDELLAELLKLRLLEDEKLLKELFGTKGVFGQFDDKVKASYAMGLISKLDYDLFKKIQNVRNKFAHRVLNISFEDPTIRDVCQSITLPKDAFMPRYLVLEGNEDDYNPITPDSPARIRFVMAFHFLFVELENRQILEQRNPLEEPSDYITYANLLEKIETEELESAQVSREMEKVMSSHLLLKEKLIIEIDEILKLEKNIDNIKVYEMKRNDAVKEVDRLTEAIQKEKQTAKAMEQEFVIIKEMFRHLQEE